MRTRDLVHRVIAARRILRRRKVGRRREAIASEHRRDVPGDADTLAGTQPRRVDVSPVRASRVGVIEVRVRVDERLRTGDRRARALDHAS
jgi:hypothetical protein